MHVLVVLVMVHAGVTQSSVSGDSCWSMMCHATRVSCVPGYNVKATVRNPDDEVKTAHLRALGEALPGILTLHAADLLQPGSFDDVIRQDYNGTNISVQVECILLTQSACTLETAVDVETLGSCSRAEQQCS